MITFDLLSGSFNLICFLSFLLDVSRNIVFFIKWNSKLGSFNCACNRNSYKLIESARVFACTRNPTFTMWACPKIFCSRWTFSDHRHVWTAESWVIWCNGISDSIQIRAENSLLCILDNGSQFNPQSFACFSYFINCLQSGCFVVWRRCVPYCLSSKKRVALP